MRHSGRGHFLSRNRNFWLPGPAVMPRQGAGGGAPAAHEQLLTLATDEGAIALYDSNPNTRTLRNDGGNDYHSAVADGLGNLPDLVQATAAKQPRLVASAFGDLDAMEGTGIGTEIWMGTATFTTLAQPNFIVCLVRDDETGTGLGAITAGDGSARNNFLTTGSGRSVALFAGSSKTTNLAVGNTSRVLGGTFNGSSSLSYVDSVESAAVDPGTEGLGRLFTQRNAGNSFWLNGPLASIMIFNFIPDATQRQRIFDKYHELSGIPGP